MERPPRLGRGLAALLSETPNSATSNDFSKRSVSVPIDLIRSNQRNPRRFFDPTEIEALSISIKQRGLLQPILVRNIQGTPEQYEIIAGERRWRAAQLSKLHDVSVVVLNVSESEALEIALVENIQRTNLSPLEEAHGYRTLITEYGYTQEEVAKIVGKSRSHIANILRLLTLPEHTQSLLESGALTPGHARALITYPEPDTLADTIVSKGMTVREVERAAISRSAKKNEKLKKERHNDNDLHIWEDRFTEKLGTAVRLVLTGQKGEIRIAFLNLDQLEDIFQRLAHRE